MSWPRSTEERLSFLKCPVPRLLGVQSGGLERQKAPHSRFVRQLKVTGTGACRCSHSKDVGGARVTVRGVFVKHLRSWLHWEGSHNVSAYSITFLGVRCFFMRL